MTLEERIKSLEEVVENVRQGALQLTIGCNKWFEMIEQHIEKLEGNTKV